jgi:hypothetical protein
VEHIVGYEITAAVLVLAWVVIAQLIARPLVRVPFVGGFLAAIGLAAMIALVTVHVVDGTDATLMAISWVIGVGLAVARASLVRMWLDGGRIMRRGGALTTALWIVAVAQHLAIDLLLPPGVGVATIAFFFGSSLVAQWIVMSRRARPIRARLSMFA